MPLTEALEVDKFGFDKRTRLEATWMFIALFGQPSTELWPILVDLRLNLGRKGVEEAGCFVDESCLEQGVSRTNGCFELSHVDLGSGDWYVRSSKKHTAFEYSSTF